MKSTFTDEESKLLVDIDNMMGETELNYILIAAGKDLDFEKEPGSSDFYFSINSSCEDDDVALFTSLLLRIMHLTKLEYVPEEVTDDDADISKWASRVLKLVLEKIQQQDAEFKITDF